MVSTAIILILLIALDRASKVLLSAYLVGKGTVVLIPDVLGLYLLEGGNTGAAFGIMKGQTWLLVGVTLLVICGLLYCLFFKKFTSKLMNVAAIFVAAGGIGNLYDRVAYGYVTDFLKFLFMDFPIFNIADCLVDIGAALFVIAMFKLPKDADIFVRAEAKRDE